LVEVRREEAAAAVEGVVEAAAPVPVPVVPVPVDKVLAGVVTGSSELVAEVSVVSVTVFVPVVDTVLEEEPELETVAPIRNEGLVA